MKKYVLACFVVIGITLNVHLQFQPDQLGKTEITLANIEALAQGEDTNKKCWYQGSVDCPKGHIKVLYVQ